LDPVLAFVSPNARGWMKTFFVAILMTCSSLDVYSNFFATPREEPSPTSGSFNFGSFDDHLVVIFLGKIFLAIQNKFLETL
jgi:hypothetical protein